MEEQWIMSAARLSESLDNVSAAVLGCKVGMFRIVLAAEPVGDYCALSLEKCQIR